MNVILVRHGETEWARAGKHTGRTDVPLTQVGEAQARALSARLGSRPFARILVSPLTRARRTAELALPGRELTTTDDLLELDYGEDEGRTTAEIRVERPGWEALRDGPRGGETLDAAARRVRRVIASVDGTDGDVLLVAHGHILRILAACFLAAPPTFARHLPLATAAVSTLGWDREVPVIIGWNESFSEDESSAIEAARIATARESAALDRT